jgi:hypothetical protein
MQIILEAGTKNLTKLEDILFGNTLDRKKLSGFIKKQTNDSVIRETIKSTFNFKNDPSTGFLTWLGSNTITNKSIYNIYGASASTKLRGEIIKTAETIESYITPQDPAYYDILILTVLSRYAKKERIPWIPDVIGILFIDHRLSATQSSRYVYVITGAVGTSITDLMNSLRDTATTSDNQFTRFSTPGINAKSIADSLVYQACGCLSWINEHKSITEFSHNNMRMSTTNAIPVSEDSNVIIKIDGKQFEIPIHGAKFMLTNLGNGTIAWKVDQQEGENAQKQTRINRVAKHETRTRRIISKLYSEIPVPSVSALTKQVFEMMQTQLVIEHKDRYNTYTIGQSIPYDIWTFIGSANNAHGEIYFSKRIEECCDVESTYHGMFHGTVDAFSMPFPGDSTGIRIGLFKFFGTDIADNWMSIPRGIRYSFPSELIKRFNEDKLESKIPVAWDWEPMVVPDTKYFHLDIPSVGSNIENMSKYLTSGSFYSPNVKKLADGSELIAAIKEAIEKEGVDTTEEVEEKEETKVEKGKETPISKKAKPSINIPNAYRITEGSQGVLYRLKYSVDGTGSTKAALKVPKIYPGSTTEARDSASEVHVKRYNGVIVVESDVHMNEIFTTIQCSDLYKNGKSPNFMYMYDVYYKDGAWYLLEELIDGTLKDLTSEMIPKLQEYWRTRNEEEMSKGEKPIPIPTRSQIRRNILFQICAALYTFQTELKGMHADFHWKNVFLKICDDTLYMGKKLKDIKEFVYEIEGNTYNLPNIGILAKIGDLGFATTQATRTDQTPLMTTWNSMGAGVQMILAAREDKTRSEMFKDDITGVTADTLDVILKELPRKSNLTDFFAKYTTSLSMRSGRRYDPTFDITCLFLGLSSRQDWFRDPVIMLFEKLEFESRLKSENYKAAIDHMRNYELNKSIFGIIPIEKPTFFIPADFDSLITPKDLFTAQDSPFSIYKENPGTTGQHNTAVSNCIAYDVENTKVTTTTTTKKEKKFVRTRKCVCCWSPAELKCKICGIPYCCEWCANFDAKMHKKTCGKAILYGFYNR